MNGQPLLGVVGPTASGKTDLALALAERIPIEILVADSRQVYRGMDVGTASPNAAARAATPHHLLDLVEPNEPFTVADWVALARAQLPPIAARDAHPMVVGGTGLYVSALVDGHDYVAQPSQPELRERLTAELDQGGLAALAERLGREAPEVAAEIDLRNPRRVLRALERASGGMVATPPATPYPGPVALIAIDRPREVLYRRIDERARWLFTSGGLLEEVRRLGDAGYGADLRPMRGHGYLEAIGHLAGELSLEEAIASTARRTRQYAKRQLTWFRRDPRVRWLRADELPAHDATVVTLAEGVLRAGLS